MSFDNVLKGQDTTLYCSVLSNLATDVRIAYCDLCDLLGGQVSIEHQYRVLEMHIAIRQSGLPNYLGCKFVIKSGFNIEYLEESLKDYEDREIIQYLKHGWPIDHDGSETQSTPPRNHDSATKYAGDIRKYLVKELGHGAVIGPFKKCPFKDNVALSPLSTRDKKDSKERRILVDMSFPPGKSVNDGIDKHTYQGEEIQLTYPAADKLVEMIVKKGRGCKLFKRDLRRAFRQFFVDPGDISLLGYVWEDHYFFDVVLAMGCRSSPYICQRISKMIRYLYNEEGHDCVNFLDDYAGCEEDEQALVAYESLGGVMDRAGVEQSHDKNCPPVYMMIFLGILFCTLTMTMQVTKERMSELRELLLAWAGKVTYCRKELESLIGKLNFVCTCVRSSRVFMSRFLNALRATPKQGRVQVSRDMQQDVNWWLKFLPVYNGVSVIVEEDWIQPDGLISCDACLDGCGGWSEGQFFHARFPPWIARAQWHINALELLTLTVSLKVWRDKIRRKKFQVLCDNMATVIVISTGKSKDPLMQACLRELVWILATNEAEIRVSHITTDQNRIADILSRWDLMSDAKGKLIEVVGGECEEITVSEDQFRFSHDW